jgi:hypothetical protein
MSPFGGFSCTVCGASFHPLDGGVCPRCCRVLCADHFEAVKKTIVCRGCTERSAAGQAGGRVLRHPGARGSGGH